MRWRLAVAFAVYVLAGLAVWTWLAVDNYVHDWCDYRELLTELPLVLLFWPMLLFTLLFRIGWTVFESHVTVDGLDVDEFTGVCAGLGVKPVLIERDTGSSARLQLMTARFHRTDSRAVALGELDAIAARFGERVIRRKLEFIVGRGCRELPEHLYLEFHSKYVVEPVRADEFVGLAAGAGCKSSVNSLKPGVDGLEYRFATARDREGFRRLEAALVEFRRVNAIMECVVFDDNEGLDDGWRGCAGCAFKTVPDWVWIVFPDRKLGMAGAVAAEVARALSGAVGSDRCTIPTGSWAVRVVDGAAAVYMTLRRAHTFYEIGRVDLASPDLVEEICDLIEGFSAEPRFPMGNWAVVDEWRASMGVKGGWAVLYDLVCATVDGLAVAHPELARVSDHSVEFKGGRVDVFCWGGSIRAACGSYWLGEVDLYRDDPVEAVYRLIVDRFDELKFDALKVDDRLEFGLRWFL